MYFWFKADLKFRAQWEKESLEKHLRFLQGESYRNNYPWLSLESKYEISTTENGFEIKERSLNQKGIKIRAEAVLTASGNETKISVQVLPFKWSLWLSGVVLVLMVSIFVYFFWTMVGPGSLILPGFFYLMWLLNFSTKVGQVTNLIIHKICEKKVRRIDHLG